MDNVDKVILAICVGKLAGDFLFSTSRVLKAIELFKECLLLLSSKALEKEKSFVQTIYSGISVKIFYAYVRISDLTNGIECGNKLLVLLRANGERDTEGKVTFELATLFLRRSEYVKAKELYEKALCIMKEIRDRHGEATCYGNLGTVFQFCGHYAKAEEHFVKAIAITKEIGDKEEEAGCYTGLGNVFQSVGEYGKAEEYYRKAIPIRQTYGDKEGEATCYGNLGNVFQLLGEYTKAKEYCKKALAIFKEIGDKEREAACYGNLGSVFTSLCEYVKAEECLQKALAIRKKTGDRYGEAADYGNLGRVFKSVAEYTKAKKYLEKALAIKKEIGDKRGEAVCYGGIGVVYGDIGEYNKAKECLHKALRIRKEIGDREGEAADYGNLGVVFKSLGEYVKAREYLEKALAIRTEIGDRFGEATDYEGLGRMCISLGEYVEAEDYLKKALSIRTKIGDKRGEASSYRALGGVYGSLGENAEAAEYHRKALAISIEIGDRTGEASSYISLGNVSESLGEYVKAKEHFDKALAIKTEIGDRSGEALCYESLGSLFQSLGKYVKAKQHHEKALSITKVIGERETEGVSYRNLGTAFLCLGEDAKSKQCYDKALAISKEIGDVETEFQCYINLTLIMMMRGDVREVFSNLIASIQKSESMQHYLRDNDQFKISFLDTHVRPYRTLSSLYCSIGNPYQALHVVELGRARALVDLMLAKYFSERQMSVNPQSWVDIERVMNKERNCSCLYISYMYSEIFLWILKADKPILLRQIDVNERSYTERSVRDLDDFFGKEPFCRKFYVLPQGHCEDRSLGPLDVSHATRQYQEESVAAVRLVEEEDVQELKPSPRLYYKLLIAPVADLLNEPEIIIVPDRSLYKVPFAALEDENAKYLSETFRIRIVPSLTTLKLIQDRPADQYSETDPLIVGDPDVSLKTNLSQLPFARKEAEMVGRLLGVRPLIGYEATKLAVLEMMHSASLIHIAAHGDAERGEIALAPVRPVNRILQQGDFVLTMSDVAQVQLQAKLVVLSCCHSGRGQIRAEGVVGIARAFLGSGARSVLVSLWALEDKATEQFMSRFYEHLVRGESASESLHQTMKWMRGNGYSDVRQWAPFMLIGDNVTFDY